jgi:hypothetical protein
MNIAKEIARLKRRMSNIKDKMSPAYLSMQKKLAELQMRLSRREEGLPSIEEQQKAEQDEKDDIEIEKARKAMVD